ncbi:MAG TPA: TIGR02186 family protein [Candidatus Acidoferrum sp.]|nr:TIGR02186 family protein [Candidatus Acidoferrum sp.]
MKAARRGFAAGLWLLPMLLHPAGARADVPLIADSSQPLVKISAGFVGTDVLVFGAKEGPGDVVIVVRGPVADYGVRRKQRVAGVWLNADRVDFQGVPSFYAVASSRPLDKVMTSAARSREGVGIDQLKLVPAEPVDAAEAEAFTAALIRIKQNTGLFGHEVEPVRVLADRLFRAEIHLPSNVPTGKYDVEVMLVRSDDLIAQTVYLEVNKSGFGADVYDFAHKQSAAYGLIAIFGALLAGWAAHLVFRKI